MFTTGGHYIVLVADDDDVITVYDPYLYSGKFTTSSRKAANVTVSGNSVYLTETSFKTYANYKNFWIFSNDQGSGNPNATSSSSSTSSSSNTETAVSYTRYVSTSSSNLNVRSGAGTSYSVITSISKGTAVTVSKVSGNWSYITSPTKGWVSTQYLSSSKVTTTSSSSSSSTSSSNTSTTYYTIKNKCYIYANSSMSGTKYCYIANTKVKLLSKTSSSVYYIEVVKTGRKGYIYVSNLTGVTTTSTTSSSTSSSSYTTGTYKVTANLLNVRSGAGTSYSKKTYSQLTSNARSQNKSLGNYYANGYLKGVVCTVTQVKNNWGKTASGWICLDYCTKQ